MNRTALAGVLGLLLAGSIGGNAYQYSQNKKSTAAAEERNAAVSMRDSLQRVLLRLRDSLESTMPALMEENQRMAGRVQELEGNNASIVAEKQSFLNRIKKLQSQIGNMSPAEIEKFKQEIAAKTEEIKTLQAQLAKAQEDRDNNARLAETERNSRGALEQENSNMRDLVDRGKNPQFGPVLSYGVRTKNGTQEETFKAKSVEKLKITFDIIENPLVESPIEKEVKIRIIGPEGDILSRSTAALADKSTVYTLKETIVFDGEMHKVKLFYSQPDFKRGKYTVELWADEVIKQKNTFTLE